MGWPMRRGDVRLTDLEPVRGSEADKRRPAVIVSNDRANETADRLGRGVVTVVPVTGNIARVPLSNPVAGRSHRAAGRLESFRPSGFGR